METLAFVIGVIGNIISVLMFLSPVETFRRIVKHRSTEDFDSLPYICSLLNSSLWTYYGIIKPGSYLVSTVNGFGVIVEIIYIVLFLRFAHPRMRNKTATLAGVLNVGFLATALLLAQFSLHGEMRINVIGFLSTGLNVIMYSSPLGVMKTVVTTKSVEYMPFLLSFFLFLNGGIWTLYAMLVGDWFLGRTVIKMKSVEYMPFFLSFFQFLNGGVWAAYTVLVKDYYIGVPNGIGFLLGSAQLMLYFIYYKSTPTKSTEEKQEKEGSAHVMRRGIQIKDLDGAHENDNNRNLEKGKSLPKPSLVRQYSEGSFGSPTI